MCHRGKHGAVWAQWQGAQSSLGIKKDFWAEVMVYLSLRG